MAPNSCIISRPDGVLGSRLSRRLTKAKLQHAKIIGGTALKGTSVGGLIGGPPGSAVGAAAGAAVGTAYDLKTHKVKTSHGTND